MGRNSFLRYINNGLEDTPQGSYAKYTLTKTFGSVSEGSRHQDLWREAQRAPSNNEPRSHDNGTAQLLPVFDYRRRLAPTTGCSGSVETKGANKVLWWVRRSGGNGVGGFT